MKFREYLFFYEESLQMNDFQMKCLEIAIYAQSVHV